MEPFLLATTRTFASSSSANIESFSASMSGSAAPANSLHTSSFLRMRLFSFSKTLARSASAAVRAVRSRSRVLTVCVVYLRVSGFKTGLYGRGEHNQLNLLTIPQNHFMPSRRLHTLTATTVHRTHSSQYTMINVKRTDCQ